MTTKPTLSEGSKKPQTHQLDNTDKQILQLLQDDFPLVEHPWRELSSKTGIPENQLVTRIENLCKAGVIKKIGPIVDPSKVGYTAATLIALRVPENKIDDIATVINQYNNISHNYEREHEYNVWFTLVTKNNQELTDTLNEILQKTGLSQNDVLNLPTAQRFKINVNFQLTNNF
ncbi:MAG: AsnC family transcriptional regulator [Candidatus Bathyarchaeia archaeon]|jgi:DNA-binding Lrp family transcriptional regulator